MEVTETGRKTLINRRLRSTEAAYWLALPSGRAEPMEANLEKRSFEDFLQLEDSLAYIASVDDKALGGTALHRDHKRLAIGLVSLRSYEQVPSPITRHLVKSSLPFFRSASIREVDAIVGTPESSSFLPFPLGFELPPWSREILGELGFQEKAHLYACKIEGVQHESRSRNAEVWDKEASIGGAREVIWQTRKASGLSTAQSDLAIAMAQKMGTLRTVTKEEETEAFLAIAAWGHLAKVDIFDTRDSSVFEKYLRAAILSEANALGADSVLMPLVGSGQKHLVESLAEVSDGELSVRELTLLRRNL